VFSLEIEKAVEVTRVHPVNVSNFSMKVEFKQGLIVAWMMLGASGRGNSILYSLTNVTLYASFPLAPSAFSFFFSHSIRHAMPSSDCDS